MGVGVRGCRGKDWEREGEMIEGPRSGGKGDRSGDADGEGRKMAERERGRQGMESDGRKSRIWREEREREGEERRREGMVGKVEERKGREKKKEVERNGWCGEERGRAKSGGRGRGEEVVGEERGEGKWQSRRGVSGGGERERK